MARLQPVSALDHPATQLVECKVSANVEQDFSHLKVVPMDVRQAPAPDEIEIQVRAVGLNFRDVLNGMGLNLGVPGPLGADCAGVVSQVGSSVSQWEVGDQVLGIARGCLRSYAMTGAGLVIQKPASMTFEQAASVPSVFTTVYHSLYNVASLARGQTILVHAAAGGVGLCAVQLAQHLGARVLATVGSPTKERLVRSYGVQHVSSSRDHSLFEADMRAWGIKPDVILNCLTGDFIRTSVSALAPGGVFIELGKRDVWNQSQVDSLRGARDVRLEVVAIDKMLAESPAQHARLLRDVERELTLGWYRPIPILSFPFAKISDAFVSMRHGHHVGKVVLQLQSTSLSDVKGYSSLADVQEMDDKVRNGMYQASCDFFSTRFNRSELVDGLEAADRVARSYLVECMDSVHPSQVVPHLRSLHAAYSNGGTRQFTGYSPSASSLSREARAKFPSITARLDFLDHVSRSHVDIITGKVDAVSVLFSDRDLTSRLYNESPMAALFNTVVSGALAAIQGHPAVDGVGGLRALEIGAGTGGTTRAVTKTLAAICNSFCFTDLSTSFFSSAKLEFGDTIPGFSTALLNIENDPERQGFTLASYDIILAANVLHATSNLEETVKNVRALLKPGGLLVLSELTAPSAWADATFGFTEGWWRSTDERRANQPLISVSRWNEVFSRVGLEPYACSDETISAQAVMIARRPVTQPGTTRTLARYSSRPVEIHEGAYVITGGTGGLGLLTAWLLILQGAMRVSLLSRSGKLPGKEEEEIWNIIQHSRCRVTIHRCDVGDAQQLQQVLRLIEVPVLGIIHAAGHLRDASIANQSVSTFEPVMRTKAIGLLNLHRASLEMPALRSFIVFSSAAAFFGSAGQANHSSANSFMDGLVRWRRRTGLPASSIMWGAVSQIGDAARRGADRRAKMLYDPLSINDAVQAISSVLLGDLDVVLAAPLRLASVEADYKGNKRIFDNLMHNLDQGRPTVNTRPSAASPADHVVSTYAIVKLVQVLSVDQLRNFRPLK